MGNAPAWDVLTDRWAEDYPLQADGPTGPLLNGRRLQDRERVWSVTFADGFLALSTTRYNRRADFVRRLRSVWDTFTQIAHPPAVGRIGFRYINQGPLDGDVANVTEVLKPEILGLIARREDGAPTLEHGLTQVQFREGNHEFLLARVGVLPPGAILDETMRPSEQRTWLLDADAFVEEDAGDPATDAVILTVESSAERAYSFFWNSITARARNRFAGEEDR